MQIQFLSARSQASLSSVVSPAKAKSFISFFAILAAAKLGLDYSQAKPHLVKWLAEGIDAVKHLDDDPETACNVGSEFKVIVLSLLADKEFSSIETQVQAVAAWLNRLNKFRIFDQAWIGDAESRTLMSHIRVLLTKESANAQKNLEAKISILGKPQLVRIFGRGTDEVEVPYPKDYPLALRRMSNKALYKKVLDLAKSFDFNEATPPAVSPQKGNEDTPGFSTWKFGSTYLRNLARATAKSIVRTEGAEVNGTILMKVTELRKRLKDEGVDWPLLNPNLKKGEYADENLIIYTPSGKKMVALAFDAEIRYNPNYSDSYGDKYSSQKGTMTYLTYKPKFAEGFSSMAPEEFKKTNKAESFKVSAQMGDAVKAKRSSWTKDLKSSDEETMILATILELSYQAAMRIGSSTGKTTVKSSDGTTKTVKTFGLSVLEKRHVKLNKNSIRIEYIGKSAMKQIHLLKRGSDRFYNQALDNLAELHSEAQGPRDLIFGLNGAPLSNTKINAYVKHKTGLANATIHKFRHIKATEIAVPILQKSPWLFQQGTFENVFKWFVENMSKVGAELGHMRTVSTGETQVTAMTAISAYIDPSISAKFFKDCNVLLPNNIAKLLKETD